MLLTTKYYQQKLNKLDHIAIRKDCFSFIKHPENFHKELLNLIKAAQKRIYITALYLQDDECGREVLKAIFERAKECPSLNVFILVDFHRAQRGLMGKGKQVGNTLMYEELYNQYKITNIHILGVPVKTKELFGVLHLKGFVFDNTVLYSGASINNIYLGYDNKYRLDRYHKIVSEELSNSFVDFLQSNIIQDPAVCTLTNTEQLPSVKSIVDKIAKFKHRLKKSSYKFENGVNSNDCVYATPMVGLGNTHNLLNSVILKLLKTVEKEIVICTPYFNPPRQLSKSIVSLLKKGIIDMELCRLLNFTEKGDERGKLVIVEGNQDVPFEIKRLFYIYGSDRDVVRGKHANRDSEFVLINVSGTSKVMVTDGKEKQIVELTKPRQGVYLPKLVWKEMYDFSPDSVLLCLASTHYDGNEYIRNYDDFLKLDLK